MKKIILSSISLMLIGTIFLFTQLGMGSLNPDEEDSLEKDIPSEVSILADEKFNNVIETIVSGSDDGKHYYMDRFSLGNAYNLYYIRPDIREVYKNLTDFQEFITDSNDWLYIINYDANSYAFMTIASLDGINYELVQFGGNAEFFDATLENFMRYNDLSHLKALQFGANYYLLNESFDAVEIPSEEFDNSSTLKNKLLVDAIISSIDEAIERELNGEPPLRGNNSLSIIVNNYIDISKPISFDCQSHLRMNKIYS